MGIKGLDVPRSAAGAGVVSMPYIFIYRNSSTPINKLTVRFAVILAQFHNDSHQMINGSLIISILWESDHN